MELRRSTRLRRANYDPAQHSYMPKEEVSHSGVQQVSQPIFHTVSTVSEPSLQQGSERSGLGTNAAAMKDNAYMSYLNEKRSMPLQALALVKNPKYSFKQLRASYRSRLSDMDEDKIGMLSQQLAAWCSNNSQRTLGKDNEKEMPNQVDYELYRSAEDMAVLNAIVEQLRRLKDSISKVQDDYDPEKLLAGIKAAGQVPYSECEKELLRLVDTHQNSPDEEWIKALADLHQIDLQDISDVINVRHMKKTSTGISQYNHQSSRKADIQYLSNKWNKLLTRERNIALYWPNKNSHKKAATYNKGPNGPPLYPEPTGLPFSKSTQSYNSTGGNPKDKFTGVSLLY